MPFRYSYGKLSFEDVLTFFQETDREFPIPLSARVDMDSYAKKLSEFSDFAICRDGESIIGMISCYTNQPPLGYISNVCVKKRYQSKKVFSKLLHLLRTNAKELGISNLQLEVDADNDNARRIYDHYGFRVLETRPDSGKLLIELDLD